MSLNPIQTLFNAHYYLMGRKRFWYDDADMAASTILCVLASDLRKEKSEQDA